MGQILVVRHGQASLFASDYDVLSPLGIDQARKLGEHLAGEASIDAVFTGPARRQRDTATHVGEAFAAAGAAWPAPEVVPELDEHDAFAMVGKLVPDLADHPEVGPLARALADTGDRAERSRAFQRLFESIMRLWLRGEVEREGIESWPQFGARVGRALDRLLAAAEGRRVLAFTSVGPIAVMLQRALGCSDQRSFETAWRVRNASVTHFVCRGAELTVDAFNTLTHLPDRASWTFR
jgi:broad specificity phosphatase PhoE